MDKQKNFEPRVAILIFPFAAKHIYSWSSKVAAIISTVSSHTVLIGGGIPFNIKWSSNLEIRDIGIRLHYLRDRQPLLISIIIWLFKAVASQIELARQIYLLRNDIDIIFCAMGVYYQLPILIAKLLGKKVVSASMGLYSLKAQIVYGKLLAELISILTRISFTFSDVVIVESNLLSSYKDLTPFRSKIFNGALYLENPEKFRPKIPIEERKNIVGFIGRLVLEKGIMDFVDAIPFVLEAYPGFEFYIIGTGILDDVLEKTLHGKAWSSNVNWIKWIEHEEIPDYLNQLKLLIVPSYDEGLPNIILEAMGCGTPVLSTGVGGIPDLIVDQETGFILENHSPVAIAQAIIKVLGYSNINEITKNARDRIEQNYSMDSACLRYKSILNKVIDHVY